MTEDTTHRSTRHDRNRAALVQAAREGLLADGVSGLRFEHIAHRAGMTRKTVYNHFDGRVGLIEAIMDDIGVRAEFRRMGSVWDIEDPRARLSAFFASLAQSWENDREMFRLMVGLSAADRELGDAIRARIDRVRGVSAKLVAHLTQDPGLNADWTTPEAEAALFALSSFSTYDDLRASGLNQDEVARRLADMAATAFQFH